jgi:hypothetical protein
VRARTQRRPKNVRSESLPERALAVALTLLERMDASALSSFDYTDWWSTSVGRVLKAWAYRTEPLGNLAFSAPVLAAEMYAPWLKALVGLRRRVYPICVAHHGIACLSLAEVLDAPEFVSAARRDAALLVSMSVPSEVGMSWGFPFVWSTNAGVIPADLPAATQTAYGFDLLDALLQATGEPTVTEPLASVARAMDEEYEDLLRRVGIANAYHGRGHGDVVINAVTYRAHVLARASQVCDLKYAATAMALTDYVLSQQNDDGSWFYGELPKNRFVDHYHTCFVLKNLARANKVLQRSDVDDALARGAAFYWRSLFCENGLPRPFAVSVRFNPVRYESYDFAECLGLFSLLGPELGFTDERVEHIFDGFCAKLLRTSGDVRFRVYRAPTPAGYPYYRYGMSASLLALTSLLTTRLGGSRAHAG